MKEQTRELYIENGREETERKKGVSVQSVRELRQVKVALPPETKK
jgi:hypothetical protein